jgi:sugar lactone lactonase YvrE
VCELGESPRWDAATGRLWWVDLLAGLVHNLDLATGAVASIELGQPVSALARHAEGWVVAVETGVQYRDLEFVLTAELAVLARPTIVRMNDAALDPAGRFLVGSLAYDGRAGAGRLYRITGEAVEVLLDGLDISNGIAWTADGTTMYHVDSGTRTIRAHDYDPGSGRLGRARPFYVHPDDGAVPDGIALDAAGGLWVALWGGGRVIRLDPRGVVTDEVPLPARLPAGIAFGGPDLATLYITSARVELADPRPADGALFAFRARVAGAAQKLVRVTPMTVSASSTWKIAR